jgi:excisionase family DNA binding protein
MFTGRYGNIHSLAAASMLYHLDVVAAEGLGMEKAQNQLMTVGNVISAMGISRSTWQKLVAQKRTPPIVRIGAVQRIRRDAFEAWLGQHENAAAENT